VFTPKLLFGLALIVLGVLYTLAEFFSGFDPEDFLRFWPLVLVTVGLGKLLWPASDGSRVSGTILVLLGLVLQLNLLEYVNVSLWPMILVLIGVRVAWQGMMGRSQGDVADTSTVNAVAVLAGASRSSNARDFRGGDFVAFMGGCEVDLRQAQIEGEPAVIDVFVLWGGVELKVPKDWTVVVKGLPLLAAFEDKTEPPAENTGQVLIVKGFAIMGGVEVNN
jgi:predicted membrane protein